MSELDNPWTAGRISRRGLHSPRLRILTAVVLAVALVTAVTAAAYVLLITEDGETEASLVTSLPVQYPAGWNSETLTEDQQAVGVLLSLTRSSPDASLLARAVPGRPEQPFDISALGAEIEAALANEIDGFELVSQGTADSGSFETVQILYRQPDDENVQHQVMMIVIPTERQTFYLSIRATSTDFPAIENDGREVMNAIVTYLDEAGLSQP